MKRLQVCGTWALILTFGLALAISPAQVAAIDQTTALTRSEDVITKPELDQAIQRAEKALADVTDPTFAVDEEYLQNLVDQAKVLTQNFESNLDKELDELAAALNEGAEAMYLISGLAQSSAYNPNAPSGFGPKQSSSATYNSTQTSQRVPETKLTQSLEKNEKLESSVDIQKENDSTAEKKQAPAVAIYQTSNQQEQPQAIKTNTADKQAVAETAPEQQVASKVEPVTSNDDQDKEIAVADVEDKDQEVDVPQTGQVEASGAPSVVAIVITVLVGLAVAVMAIMTVTKHLRREK